jgi:hypothetical protein
MKKMIIDERDPEVINKSRLLLLSPAMNLLKVTYFVIPLVMFTHSPVAQITFIMLIFLLQFTVSIAAAIK